MLLKNKVAVVTGGSRGIGWEIAKLFLKEGALVAIAARSVSRSAETTKPFGDRVMAIATNVADPQSVKAMVDAVIIKHGRIDILVNNAGVLGPLGPFDQLDQDNWWQTVTVNLGGTFYCSRAVLPAMIKQKGGVIINLGGGGSTSLRRNFSAYAASKTAILRLTENMGAELRNHNIRVNAIAPGAVATSIQDEVLKVGAAIAGTEAVREAAEIKAGRIGVPVTLPAELALWLASDNSAPLTGKLISAPHDPWRSMTKEQRTKANETEAFTLRRIKFDG